MSDDQFDRVPPQDIDAEMSVLGSMMLTTEAANVVSEMLRGQDFYQPSHETIFDTIVELTGRAEPADAITVAGELKRQGLLSKVGGAAYLHSLIASVPTAANAGYYARIVRERAIMRRLVSAGTRVVQLGYADAGGDVDEIVDQAQAEVFAVSDGRDTSDYVSMNQMSSDILGALEDIERNQGKLRGVPTGFIDLDELTQGLHGGQMIIVAARPAMGKSTLALDFCRSASIKHGITSLIFSLEMSSQEIAMRMLSAESGVFLSKMQAGKMNDRDWQNVSATTSRISEAPLYVDDSANITIAEIRSKCRRLKQQENLGLVVVDYLQLMTIGRQVESRQQEVSAMSRNLKLLAKDLDIPVVAVAQLNRNSEGRTDRKPMMSDLRESGSLEQDADIIILLHRPDYYDENTERKGEADIIVAKHRAGPTATIGVLFQGDVARFANRTDRPEPGTSVADAFADLVGEIEDRHGVAVDVVCVGDRVPDRDTEVIVAATREALSNAVRHGTPPVSLYVEASAQRLEVFVRDRGPGFDTKTIAEDRHGVRESIIARMERHGGSARVRRMSTGTEVALTLPVRAH